MCSGGVLFCFFSGLAGGTLGKEGDRQVAGLWFLGDAMDKPDITAAYRTKSLPETTWSCHVLLTQLSNNSLNRWYIFIYIYIYVCICKLWKYFALIKIAVTKLQWLTTNFKVPASSASGRPGSQKTTNGKGGAACILRVSAWLVPMKTTDLCIFTYVLCQVRSDTCMTFRRIGFLSVFLPMTFLTIFVCSRACPSLWYFSSLRRTA